MGTTVELCDMAFQCELMDDPVIAADGHTCEATLRSHVET
jgi:hypothetical protein